MLQCLTHLSSLINYAYINEYTWKYTYIVENMCMHICTRFFIAIQVYVYNLFKANMYFTWPYNHTSHHTSQGVMVINSLAPGGFENIFQNVFFKLISWIDTLSNSCETALRSMPQNPSGDKSTLVQVMAWCRQAASHYLSQCCPRSLSPYGVTRPQC